VSTLAIAYKQPFWRERRSLQNRNAAAADSGSRIGNFLLRTASSGNVDKIRVGEQPHSLCLSRPAGVTACSRPGNGDTVTMSERTEDATRLPGRIVTADDHPLPPPSPSPLPAGMLQERKEGEEASQQQQREAQPRRPLAAGRSMRWTRVAESVSNKTALQLRWSSMVRDTHMHSFSATTSRRHQRMEAREKHEDRIGYGLVGPALPPAVLCVMISALWVCGSLMDSFSGQIKCEGVGRILTCEKQFMGDLLKNNQTSVHAGHSRMPRYTGKDSYYAAVGGGGGWGGAGGSGAGKSPKAPLGGRRQLSDAAAAAAAAAPSAATSKRCEALIALLGCDFDTASLLGEAQRAWLMTRVASSSSSSTTRLGSGPCAAHCPAHSAREVAGLVTPREANKRQLLEDGGGGDSAHPSTIKSGLIAALVAELVVVVVLCEGLFRHPLVQGAPGVSILDAVHFG
jgi:hypothetical protein